MGLLSSSSSPRKIRRNPLTAATATPASSNNPKNGAAFAATNNNTKKSSSSAAGLRKSLMMNGLVRGVLLICVGLLLLMILFLASAPSADSEAILLSLSHLEEALTAAAASAAEASGVTSTSQETDDDDDDANCPFRDSPIYRKVYVYPNRGETAFGWGDPAIMSDAYDAADPNSIPAWPWLQYDALARHNATAHYNIDSQNVQYATELLVRELMVNPKSCLRTMNPDEATLFYVPYLPSMEHHLGHNSKTSYDYSPWGKAIVEILENANHDEWEQQFGLTSRYWQRRNGSDHILVFSEPMHGLWHPRMKRGNFHFIRSQYQLHPPIVISVELSTTFVQQYPHCAAKNILVPYPNTDGRWFNTHFAKTAKTNLKTASYNITHSPVALPQERALRVQELQDPALQDTVLAAARPVAQYYKAGNHGTCTQLRKSMMQDYQSCTKQLQLLDAAFGGKHYAVGMRLSTFCPCPGGDSPSAKRMYDAIIAGCIPIVLSHDFVWPFTREFDANQYPLHPDEFSIRLQASDYDTPLLDPSTCQPNDPARPGLQAYLESLPLEEIARLRKGMDKARYLYSWYPTSGPDTVTLPENPLRDGVLPTGGAAHTVVDALAKRAAGALWPACREEMKTDHGPNAQRFLC